MLGPGAPAQIFAAFFSDLAKDPYDCILLLRTCFGSRTQAVASLPRRGRRAASVVTATTAEAVAGMPGQGAGLGGQRCQRSPGPTGARQPLLRGNKAASSEGRDPVARGGRPALQAWTRGRCCQYSVSYYHYEVLPVTERDFDHRNSSSFDLVP